MRPIRPTRRARTHGRWCLVESIPAVENGFPLTLSPGEAHLLVV